MVSHPSPQLHITTLEDDFSSSTAQHSAAQQSTAQHQRSTAPRSTAQHSTAQHSTAQRQRQWKKHFPLYADGQGTEGPIPSQEGTTALSMSRALASKGSQRHGAETFGLATAMFCLLTAIADVDCILGKWQSFKSSIAVSSCICRIQDSFILPKGSQCASERRPKGSQCPSEFVWAHLAAAMMVSLSSVNSSLSLLVQMRQTLAGTSVASGPPALLCFTMSSITDNSGTACDTSDFSACSHCKCLGL